MKPGFSTVGIANATAATGKEMDAKSILASILEVQRMLEQQPQIDVPRPDRNGNVYPQLFCGMPVHVSDMIPTTKQVAHMRERKWSHRTRFQKERRFDITYETKPNNDVYLLTDKVVMNRQQFDDMRDDLPALERSMTYSMGMSIGLPDHIPMEPARREFSFDFNIRPQSVASIRGGV